MPKTENCEIRLDKETFYSDLNAGLSVSNENKSSSKQAAESSPFPAILEVLARNKPILDVLSVTCLILIFASVGVVICLVVLYGKSSPQASDSDPQMENSRAKIVLQGEWLARPPKGAVDQLKWPVHNVIIAHTATAGCTTQSECVAMVRRIQSFHMDSYFFSDIGFNFLVGLDGNVYEGRGWEWQGAHTKGFNKDSICIALIGTFTSQEAQQPQLNAVRRLIATGVEEGRIDPQYRLYGQRQLAPTESPGEALHEQIKVWPNWSSELGPRHY